MNQDASLVWEQQDSGPATGTSADLARKLVLGQKDGCLEIGAIPRRKTSAVGWGRAVFLVGAGCSASAGIPLASGMAQRCAVELATAYRRHDGGDDAAETFDDAESALDWLERVKDVPTLRTEQDLPDWGRLYDEFFSNHYTSPNQQRAVITRVVEDSGHKLNWAHACLGELVALRYVHTVLTTNFDQLVVKGVTRAGVLPLVVEGLEGLNRVTSNPRQPQVVHLHGSLNTYNTRNSRAAVLGTEQHASLGSVLYAMLQQSDVLVVVGYAGGEEGVMALLDRVARELPDMVIYWVMYESDRNRLSPQAKKLMGHGGNKYLMPGVDADRFFRDLMYDLKLGVPRWIADPALPVVSSKNDLAIRDDLDTDIRNVMEAFSRAAGRAEAPLDDVGGTASALRLRGDYKRAVSSLASADRGLVLERLRAMTKYDQAQFTLLPAELEVVVQAFERIADEGEHEERLLTVRQLLPVLLSLYERTADEALLDKAVAHCDRVLADRHSADPVAHSEVRLGRALAIQTLGERRADEERLKTALEAYETVEAERRADRDTLWADAKAGVATACQALGELLSDLSFLVRAVDGLRELVSSAFATADPLTEAGRRFNLAGALYSLAVLAEGSGELRLDEAERELGRMFEILEEREESELAAARDLLGKIHRRLGRPVDTTQTVHGPDPRRVP